jgi:type IV secretion system protein TrbD
MEKHKSDEAREVPIYQSPNRANLLLGCDREALLFVGLMAAALIFSVARLWAIAVGCAAFVFAVAFFSRMAKLDPLMRHVYVRHVRYRGFYPAKSGLRAEVLPVGNSWLKWR